jgi:hypothetical protein
VVVVVVVVMVGWLGLRGQQQQQQQQQQKCKWEVLGCVVGKGFFWGGGGGRAGHGCGAVSALTWPGSATASARPPFPSVACCPPPPPRAARRPSKPLTRAQIGMILFNLGLTYGFAALGDMTGVTLPSAYMALPDGPGSPLYSVAGAVCVCGCVCVGGGGVVWGHE